MEDSQRFHREKIIIDGLNASWFFNDEVFQKLHQGGITAAHTTISAWHGPAETLDMVGQMYGQLDKKANGAMQVRTIADIHTAKSKGLVGCIFGFQDTAPIGDQLHLLRVYHELGVRIIQLTYNTENLVGCGCQATEDKGLTPFGQQVVAEMNRLGILIDLSHCGPKTTMDAIEASEMPVAITHANPASRFPHPRNKSDEILKALSRKSGVVGTLSFPAMLTDKLPASIDDYLNVIDGLIEMVGIDSVGLGPDFMEYMPKEIEDAALQNLPPEMQELFRNMPPVDGFSSIAEMPNVTHSLLGRGYTTDETAKIMGENWIQLYERVWRD